MTNPTISFLALFSIFVFLSQAAHIPKPAFTSTRSFAESETPPLSSIKKPSVHQPSRDGTGTVGSGGKFPITGSSVGFARASGVGVSVQKGTSATLEWRLTLKAVRGNDLVRNDAEFVKRLTRSEAADYKQRRSFYDGGLRVPFLDWLGVNLEANVTTADMQHARGETRNFDRLATQAERILANQPMVNVQVTGRKTLTGTSFIPRVFYAYVKVAKVVLTDGRIVYVVSTSPTDSTYATLDGNIIQARGAEKFNVEILDG